MVTENLTPKTIGGLKIMPVQERTPFLNVLIYGDSGVGKTTLAGSADGVPSMRPVLFVDIEGGTESLRNLYPDVEQVRVRTWDEMQALYSELFHGKHSYQTIVLDSLTEIQKFNMYGVMLKLIETRPDLDPDIPGMREWGKNLEQMRKFIRGFRDLPMHTIFTALTREDKNPRTGQVTKKPSMNGKLADEAAAFLDIVGYYYTKEVAENGETKQRRVLLTQKTEDVVAKDRTGRLSQILLDPTMSDLFNNIYNTTNQKAKN